MRDYQPGSMTVEYGVVNLKWKKPFPASARIAHGHAYDKHVRGLDEFPTINSREEFARLLEGQPSDQRAAEHTLTGSSRD